MPIKVNSGRVYAGAATRIIPPVTEEDCTIFPALELLVTEEEKAGRGCTIRQGRGWAKRTVEEIENTCTPATPNPTSTTPHPIILTLPFDLYGTGFYDVVGQVHFGNASTWAASAIKVLQPVSTWTDTEIHITAATWGPVPATIWIYLLNKYGLRNENGLQRTLWGPP